MSKTCRVLQNKGFVITSPYGQRSSGWHAGVDIVGTGMTCDYIIAHSAGTVVWVQNYNKNDTSARGDLSYGNAVKIKHSNGWYTLYAHMSKIMVKNGQTVKEGQVIGYMGNTGHSFGAHLHFEVRKGAGYSTTTNPKPYLNDDLSLSAGTEATIAKKGYLSKGDTGADVKDMQNKLISCGFSCGSCGADGSFGDATEAAVKKFQKAYGLEQDGYYGPITQAKLKEVYEAKQKAVADTKPVESNPTPATSVEVMTKYMTENGLYDADDLIDVKGIILHSVGCAVDNVDSWYTRWNKSTYVNALVNGFIDDKKCAIAVPSMEKKGKAVRTYHVANRTTHAHYMGFEMCEYGGIEYISGGSWDHSNINEVAAYAKKTYANAVALFAKLCEFHGLDPLADGVILSHYEASLRGMASNHGDVEHIWKYIGLTMDQFRKDVKTAMSGGTITIPSTPSTSTKPSTPTKTTLAVDGSWGPACTKRSQQYMKTTQDGKISNQPSSNKKYLSAASTTSWQFKDSNYSAGSSFVKALQKFLKDKKYYTGAIDGFMGQMTVKAFQSFLKDKKYYTGAIDGSMGPATVKAWQTYLNKN